jgi:signal transduction histidine kinase
LKHRREALSTAISLFLLLCVLACFAGQAAAAPARPAEQTSTIAFRQAESVFDQSLEIPTSGWTRQSIPHTWPLTEAQKTEQAYRAVWLRMRFDRSALPAEALALLIQDNREQVMIFVNGTDIFRNFAQPDERTQAWYRPYLVPIPNHVLRETDNEIVVRIGTRYILQAGPIVIGPERELQSAYAWRFFWRDSGVRMANYAMLGLGAVAFLVWLFRRKEPEYLFLTLASLIWFANDYQFFATVSPRNEHLFAVASDFAIYPAMIASLGFCLLYLKDPHSWKIIIGSSGIGIGLWLLFWLGAIDNGGFYLLSHAVNLVVCGKIIFGLRRSSPIEHWLTVLILVGLTVGDIHDMGRFKGIDWWDGLGFYMQPFTGFVFCAAFLLSFGRRAVLSFSSLENVNRDLEQRISVARQELVESEDARHKLEVERALEGERERLMREVHDGIGSNLVTALAIAERERQPGTTVRTLRRAISDLKLTVDSLEPVNGDIVLLLANFRHRLEPDLRRAGIAIRWDVKPCRNLPWLDPGSALHVLRVFQEAASNAVSHSGAKTLELGCHEEERAGRWGVSVFISDDGSGFDTSALDDRGKGLSSMRARIGSLHGEFGCSSDKVRGTTVSVWLPLER